MPEYHGPLNAIDKKGQERTLDLLTVVAPMYNEAETVEVFYGRLRDALDGLPWELMAVDDGSTDETPLLLARLSEEDSRVRAIRLSRNFGHQAALAAGTDHASGDAVVTIDADLQDPPELIPEMVQAWRGGADVVAAVRRQRQGESRLRLAAIRLFYRLFERVAPVGQPGNAGDFRLIDRRVLDVLSSMRERNRYFRGLTAWVGFEQASVHYDRDPRFAGETKYPFRKLVQLAIDGVASFSYVPLRAAAVLGFAVSVIALIGIPVVIVLRIFNAYVPGIASVLMVVLLLGGIQLMTLGVIGEYLGRTYDETKGRPIYVVRDQYNLPPEIRPPGSERVGTEIGRHRRNRLEG